MTWQETPWQTAALAIAAVTFGAFIVWRVMPDLGKRRRPLRKVLEEARARVAAATDDRERAIALCDAGDACASRLGRGDAATQYYLRAMRLQPLSLEILQRAIHGLRARPRALEKLLWRRLGSTAWTGDARATVRVVLEELARLYGAELHNQVRARALAHAATALQA